jgi:CheY-like chemotaxis protein
VDGSGSTRPRSVVFTRASGRGPAPGTEDTLASTRQLKILLIEDNANLREVVAQMLAQDGHTVLEAANGWEGLAILQAAESVDLVLTDLKMPGLSGWEVVRAIRACWPGLRVGLLTGTPDALVEQREPVDLVITKPVSLETLRNAVACLDAQER